MWPITPERSWRNFWVVVGVGTAMTLAVFALRPEYGWLMLGVTALCVVAMLVDSYLAGRRQ